MTGKEAFWEKYLGEKCEFPEFLSCTSCLDSAAGTVGSRTLVAAGAFWDWLAAGRPEPCAVPTSVLAGLLIPAVETQGEVRYYSDCNNYMYTLV